MAFVFQGGAMNTQALLQNRDQLDNGPKIDSLVLLCLAIPAVMLARSALLLCQQLLHGLGEQRKC